jgi:hypothetical protein
MARKLLFLLGIVAAHGVLAAGLTSESKVPRQSAVVDTCARAPGAPLRFDPLRELLAYVVTPRSGERAGVSYP